MSRINDLTSHLQHLKSGGRIHIKKENKGKFTDYCGGKVTEECIQRGKHSSNPTIRKRATFADNARGWSKKHQAGGVVTDPVDTSAVLYSTANTFPVKAIGSESVRFTDPNTGNTVMWSRSLQGPKTYTYSNSDGSLSWPKFFYSVPREELNFFDRLNNFFPKYRALSQEDVTNLDNLFRAVKERQ